MKNTVKNKKNISPLFIALFVILLLYSLVMLGILLWGLLTSFKSTFDYFDMRNVIGLPNVENSRNEMFRFANYVTIWKKLEVTKNSTFISAFGTQVHSTYDLFTRSSDKSGILMIIANTVLYVVVGAIIEAIVPAVTAYICAKYRNKFTKALYVVALTVMAMPIVGTYPTTIAFLQKWNLFDSFIGNFIQKFSFCGMYFFVYYAFFAGVSDTYMEAAEIDGASQLQIMVRIIMPLASKMIFTVALIVGVGLYNDYNTQLLYLPTKPTLTYTIYYINYVKTTRDLSGMPIRAASCIMLSLPMIVIFICFKNKLMGNISLGGIKE